MFVRLTLHPAAVPVPTVIVPRPLPTVAHHAALPAGAGLTQLVLVVYLTESAKYASSAVTMFRRSDFIERSEEHTSELQSRLHLVCRLLLEKKKQKNKN